MTYPTERVESSNVATVAYDDKTRILTVGFLNGSLYEYYDVPPGVGNSFPYLASKGQGVWQLLRGKYAYQRIK